MNYFKPAIILIAGVLILVMAGCASNRPITVKSTNTIRGKITAIERGTKTITVQSNEGEPVAVQLNNLAYDPDMVLVGKNVEIQLQRTYSLTLHNPENALQLQNSSEQNATVERINFKEKVLYLKQHDGSVLSLNVKENAGQFDKVKQGDRVIVHYTDSMVILVRDRETSSVLRNVPKPIM